MNGRPQIAVVVGSQRDGSHTETAAAAAIERMNSEGAQTDTIDVSTLDLPLFDPDNRDAGDAESVRRRVREADAVLLATPMYHGTIASPLKTVLDYCTAEEFEDTVVGFLVIAGGGFPTPVLDHLQSVARSFNTWVLPTQVTIPNSYENFEDGAIVDDDLRDRVLGLGADMVDYASVEEYPETSIGCAAPVGD